MFDFFFKKNYNYHVDITMQYKFTNNGKNFKKKLHFEMTF